MAKKKTLAQRIKADPALKAKYLKNPGLRSKLPTQYLTPEQRAMRAQNAYNAAPITPGSTVTNRALALESKNATTVRYDQQDQALAKQLERQQALQRDTGGWYDTYKADLARHAQNTQAINAQAQQQIQGLGNSMRAMDAAGTNPTTADSQASLVRQQMLAGFGSQQAATGAANNQYADLLANVVAPTQGLQARAGAAQRTRDVGDQITALQAEKGAYGAEYRATRTADETKNVLAGAALQLDAGNTAADNTRADAQLTESKRNNAASRSATRSRLRLDADRGAREAERARREAAKDKTQRENKTGPYAQTSKSNGKDRYGNTKVQRRSAQDGYERAKLLGSQYGKALKSRGVEGAAAFLATKGISALNARAAAEQIVHGKVSAKTRAQLQRRGVGFPKAKAKTIGTLKPATTKAPPKALTKPTSTLRP